MASIDGRGGGGQQHRRGVWRHRTAPVGTRRAPSHGRVTLACIAILMVGCVGINPRWDEPAGDTTGDRGATTGTETTAEESSSESGDAPEPACPGAEMLCDGECRDVANDKKACGADCLDCTRVFDAKDARCEQGVCVDRDGDGDDDDGDDGDD